MYIPAHYKEDRLELLHGLMAAHPLGALVRAGEDGLDADHVPFQLIPPSPEAPHGILRAHVARANPLWREDGARVMVLFQGDSGYVSPLRYDLHALQGRMVPTWDYAVVHAHGRLRTVDDGGWLLAHMRAMSAGQEGSSGAGWKVEDAPADYIGKLVKATVGIEIVIERLDGKWKPGERKTRRPA